MYTYYGAISFQVMAIFFAAALVLATIPLTVLPDEVWRSAAAFSSECFAIALAIIGWLFFDRNQQLADRWLRNPDFGGLTLPDWFDKIDRTPVGETPTQLEKPKGRVYATASFGLVVSFIILSMVLLILGIMKFKVP